MLWDGVSYTIALDGGIFGFPDGAAIDALAIDPFSFSSWLSFDTTVDLSGNVFRDADVCDELFNKVFDATAAGVPAGTAMLTTGLAAIGLAARRRRQVQTSYGIWSRVGDRAQHRLGKDTAETATTLNSHPARKHLTKVSAIPCAGPTSPRTIAGRCLR